jgi:Mrp family chromosome partitioning ATPase/capsular polysaccharide biosynthesis protein
MAGCLVAVVAEVRGAFRRWLAVSTETAGTRDIREYLRPVLKRWWLILAVVPVVTIGTYLYYDNKPKTYGASTELFFEPSAVSQYIVGGFENRIANEGTIENLALLIQTPVVGRQAEKILAESHQPKPQGSVSAEHIENSNFVVLSATASTPKGASLLANAYARAFVLTQQQQQHGEAAKTLKIAEKQLASLPKGTEQIAKRQALEEQIQTLRLVSSQSAEGGFRVVERAFPSATALNHEPLSNAIFAFVLSLMLSIAACFGLEYLTRKITSIEDVEMIYELPVLTEVPKVDAPTPFGSDGAGIEKQLHEPFHRLQLNLDMLSHERPLRTILIASAAPGEGKSVITRNLGLAYQEAGHNVAVLDADFRKATLGDLLSASDGPGLTDVLAGRASFGQAVQEIAVRPGENGAGENGNGAAPAVVSAPGRIATASPGTHGELALVPAGPHTTTIGAAIASGAMQQTLSAATDVYDRVLIDSSPLLAAADVIPLLSEVDGVLVVSRFGVSTRDSAKRLMRELRRVPNINLIGVVVNGIPARTYRSRAYGYYYG